MNLDECFINLKYSGAEIEADEELKIPASFFNSNRFFSALDFMLLL